MTIEERIEKASARVQNYWHMMDIAKEFSNESDEQYWMYKWAAACEVYEIITGTKWHPIEED